MKGTWRILKAAIGHNKKGGTKFPEYFFEEPEKQPSQSGDGSDVGADGECASVHFPPPPPSELPPSNKQTFPLLEGMTGNRLFEDDCIRNMEAVPKRQRL